jgi:ribosomal protein RSM22 (predicted rRNA methylase)
MLRSGLYLLSKPKNIKCLRFGSTYANSKQKISIEDPDVIYDSKYPVSEDASQLHFAHRATGETFGQLVNEVHHDRDPLHNSRVITPEEALEGVDPRYRNPETGELLEAATSKDARLDKESLWGRINQKQVNIPDEFSNVIQNNLLFQYDPKALKQHVVEWYTSINESGIRELSDSELSADVSIAASFAQDYAVSYQVLDEFVKRIGKENMENKIQSILDVGVGPSIGMLALNEIMGEEWNPARKDSIVFGNFHMARRAKIMLSRQVNENYSRSDDVETYEEEKSLNITNDYAELIEQTEIEESSIDSTEFVGKVKTKNLKIKTVLLDKLRPKETKYDLIIVSYQLLRSLENFPFEVDAKLEEYVRRLNPGGHLVLIERGTPLGAEIIARARQVILRPEKYEGQTDKFPRPFRSSSKKLSAKQQLRLSRLSPEEKALAMKDIEPELLENFDIVETEEEMKAFNKLDEPIDLSVIAPCSHHGKCPLQFFDPQVYLYGKIGKKLKFCSYSVAVHRPKYLMELKRGRKLAVKWTSPNSGVGTEGLAKSGRGRENGNDFETASYSYLMVTRSVEDPIKLEEQRAKRLEDGINPRNIGYRAENRGEYPRILSQPIKKKGFVVMDLCAPSGHVEKWHISKSVGKQEYHDARKSNMGDLWALGNKSAVQSKKENIFYFQKIEEKRENLRKMKKRDSTRLKRKIKKEYKEALETDPDDLEGNLVRMSKIDAYEFLAKPKEAEKMNEKRKYKY